MTFPTLPSIAFPYDLDRLDFTGGTAGGSLAVALTLGEEEIFSTTLTLDSSGSVTLSDLASLLISRLEETAATLTLAATYDSTTDTQSCTLLPCRARLGCTAEKWVRRYPLTLSTGVKTVALGERQYFALYGTGWSVVLDSLITNVGLVTGNSSSCITTKELDGLTYVQLDWTDLDLYADLPAVYAEGFTVRLKCTPEDTTAPTIQLTYRVVVPPYGAQTLLYRNAFGQWETLLFASVTQKDKPTRTNGTFEGYYRNYLVENGTTYEAVSYSLLDGELLAASDFLEAVTICRATDNVALALTDGTLEASSTPDALPRLEATWRETPRTPVRGQLPANVFDSTFDDTYN